MLFNGTAAINRIDRSAVCSGKRNKTAYFSVSPNGRNKQSECAGTLANMPPPRTRHFKEWKMPDVSRLCATRRGFTAFVAGLGLSAMLAVAVPNIAGADDKDVAQALRVGGLVIVVRHGATFPDQADTDPLNFDNIAAQRNLNDKGKSLAKAFGDALREVGAPIGTVYTSRYNRAYETAVIAGFKDIVKTPDLTEGGLVVSPNENNRRAEALRKMLATPPKAGPSTILITHQPNIIAALGKDWFDVKEGEASIFRPENGTYQLLARVQMDEWARIAKVAAK